MSYEETLEFLYGLQRFGVKLGLDNIRRLLERIGHPERSFPIIHVAGTNGKGSVCAAIAHILHKAGVRTGLYTSPHLHSFTERIQINGKAIPEDALVQLTQELQGASTGIPVTFFEFTTALALEYFRQQGIDWAVLEVGMGGRLDATNAVTPALCVITPVSEDHREHLGNDLKAIAREKAGIIKRGVPVIVGRQEPGVLSEIEAVADAQGAPLQVFGHDFHISLAGDHFNFQGRSFSLPGLKPRLVGRHQRENLSLALAALEVLHPQLPGLSEEVLRRGITNVNWPGRLETKPGSPPVLLDGAHNPAGAKALAMELARRGLGTLPWIIGLSGERDPGTIIEPWLPHMANVYIAEPRVGKAVPAGKLAHFLENRPCKVHVCSSPGQALAQARAECGMEPLLVVAGSLYLVADVRQILHQEDASP